MPEPALAIPESVMPEQRSDLSDDVLSKFEAASFAKIEELLQEMAKTREKLAPAGMPDYQKDIALLRQALNGMQQADSKDLVRTYFASFDYLLNRANPEISVLPVNECLDDLYELLELYEEQLSANKYELENTRQQLVQAKENASRDLNNLDAQKAFYELEELYEERLSANKNKPEHLELLLAEATRIADEDVQKLNAQTAALLTELTANHAHEPQYPKMKAYLEELQSKVKDAHEVITRELSKAGSPEELQQVRSLLHTLTDNIHDLAASNKNASAQFIAQKNQCREVVKLYARVRSGGLASEKQRENKILRQVAWQGLQAVAGGSGGALVHVAKAGAIAVSGVADAVVAVDTIQTIHEREHVSSSSAHPEAASQPAHTEAASPAHTEAASPPSAFDKAKQWFKMGVSVVGLAVGIALTVIPLTTPVGIALTTVSFVGATYTLKQMRDTRLAEKARAERYGKDLDAHQDELNQHINSKAMVREDGYHPIRQMQVLLAHAGEMHMQQNNIEASAAKSEVVPSNAQDVDQQNNNAVDEKKMAAEDEPWNMPNRERSQGNEEWNMPVRTRDRNNEEDEPWMDTPTRARRQTLETVELVAPVSSALHDQSKEEITAAKAINNENKTDPDLDTEETANPNHDTEKTANAGKNIADSEEKTDADGKTALDTEDDTETGGETDAEDEGRGTLRP